MTETLPFSEAKQDAILGHLICDPRFFRQARAVVQPAWFLDPYNSKIWRAALDFFKNYQRPPTVEELRDSKDFSLEDQATKTKIVAKIDGCAEATAGFQLDALSEELTNWIHARMYWEGVNKSKDLFNAQKFDQAYGTLKEMSKQIDQTSFGNDFEVSFENFQQDFEQSLEMRQSALTFGLTMMDRILLPDAEFGSLLPGDTTVLLAPTNAGKTSTMITVACHNLRRGKSVLLIAHEGAKEDIRDKIWCGMLGINKAQLFQMYRTQEGVNKLTKLSMLLGRFLTFVYYPKAGATIEEVEGIVRRKQDERVAKHGKTFDLMIDDYPAKLSTAMAKGGQFGKRHIDEISYGYFVQLALEYKSHALLPVQSNRNGSKINKFANEEDRRCLTGEDVQEAFGVIQQATTVITLNRDPIAEKKGYLTFYVDKSRSNEKSFAIVCKTDYGNATTHSDGLGSVWYRGMDIITHRQDFDDIFTNYVHGAVPDHVLGG